jgi:tetratricopeptide (TPR) repeat protein
MAESIDNLLHEAMRARRERRHEDAKQDLLSAAKLARAGGSPQDLASVLTALGQVERDLNHLDTARNRYEEAAEIHRAEGNQLRLAHAIRHVGDILRHEKQMDRAEACYHEALAIYRNHRDTSPLEMANAIRGMAILSSELGRREQAQALWKEARDLYASAQVVAGVEESERRIAELTKQC